MFSGIKSRQDILHRAGTFPWQMLILKTWWRGFPSTMAWARSIFRHTVFELAILLGRGFFSFLLSWKQEILMGVVSVAMHCGGLNHFNNLSI